MTPLTAEQALAELRKFAGIQFDPVVVDAFVKTHHVEGVADPGRTVQPRPIPLIGQAAATRLQEPPATGTLPANAALPAASGRTGKTQESVVLLQHSAPDPEP